MNCWRAIQVLISHRCRGTATRRLIKQFRHARFYSLMHLDSHCYDCCLSRWTPVFMYILHTLITAHRSQTSDLWKHLLSCGIYSLIFIYLSFFFFLVAGTHEIIQKNIHSFLTIFGMIVSVLIHFKSKCTSFSRCWTCFQLLICYWIALFWKIVDLIDYNERESPFYSLNCWFFILTFVILYNETIIQLFFTECLLLFLYRYCLCPVS